MLGTRDASCVVERNDLAPDVVYDSLLNTVVVRGALRFLQQMSVHSDMH